MLLSQSHGETLLSVFAKISVLRKRIKVLFVSGRRVVSLKKNGFQSEDCGSLTAVDRHVVRSKKINFDLKIAG